MSFLDHEGQERNDSTTWASSALCGQNISGDPSTSSLLSNVRFYGQGVSVIVLGSLGLIGNGLAVFTIVSMPSINLFYKLLVTLVLFDVVFILTGGLFIVQTAFGFDLPIYYRWFPVVIYPVAGMSMTGSTYCCLSIAAERFLGICHHTLDQCPRKFRYYFIGIITACVFIDMPRYFEVQTTIDEASGKAIGLEYTALRTDGTYILAYFMWYRLLTTIVIPCALILFFNIQIFYYYKRTSLSGQNHQEKSLLAIFSCITITFFACHLPRAVLNGYEFHLHSRSALCRSLYSVPFTAPLWVHLGTSLEKILLVFNASANFVYYCFSGREFRNRFLFLIRCRSGHLSCKTAEEPETQLRQQTSKDEEEEEEKKQNQKKTVRVTYCRSDSNIVQVIVEYEEEEEEEEEEEVKYHGLQKQFLGHIYRDNLDL